ncbi:hypothetical protein GCM10009715_10770 [Paeniglutamicibacter psychrophenolicus]|uniref:DUF4231 domain-containing protein n=1 Tax=Paeniglutamicibacter psychrophenolicus TaxID=257454 RepID=A0ABS4WG58_9MICC|nr:DUF4231 domain-containing protein [Paeniglutamicibacter psychrophenolicus]MBP2375178.1 hypothetical protein [Paeniglutamicibacter psychrophenolicus]MDQ0094562.1 hypothetical protein [Paeniglutamicibacter psychrophenolicus]
MARAKRKRRPEWEKLASDLPEPQDSNGAQDLLWQMFSAQFRWYDRAASRSRWAYQGLKALTLASGASVTVLAALAAPAALTALVGGLIVLFEGLQQIGQFHAKWLNYRSTAERMRHEGFFFAAGVGAYANPERRRERLARFIEESVSTEHAAWTESAGKGAEPTKD